MALLDSKKEFPTTLTDAMPVANYCADHFRGQGYTVSVDPTPTGAFISFTKGGTFKAISGQKTGLNITLTVWPGKIEAAMEVGIFGKQAIPTAIAAFAFWPIIIPQIMGMVKQNSLDKEAYRVIETAIAQFEPVPVKQSGYSFCPSCGKKVSADASFCDGCGAKVNEKPSNICLKCGCHLSPTSAFCPQCGTKIR